MPSPSSPTSNATARPPFPLNELGEITINAAKEIAVLLTHLKAAKVVLYDVRAKAGTPGLSHTNFVLLASGSSTLQVKSLWQRIYLKLKKENRLPLNSEKKPAKNSWLLLDYDELIIHFFTAEARAYYQLEENLKAYPPVFKEKEEPTAQTSTLPVEKELSQKDAAYWEKLL